MTSACGLSFSAAIRRYSKPEPLEITLTLIPVALVNAVATRAFTVLSLAEYRVSCCCAVAGLTVETPMRPRAAKPSQKRRETVFILFAPHRIFGHVPGPRRHSVRCYLVFVLQTVVSRDMLAAIRPAACVVR